MKPPDAARVCEVGLRAATHEMLEEQLPFVSAMLLLRVAEYRREHYAPRYVCGIPLDRT